MKDKFYIVRYYNSGDYSISCVVPTLAAALSAVHDKNLYDKGAFIEICRGCYPSSYEICKILRSNGRCSA